MSEHRIGTREEWEAARAAVRERESELRELQREAGEMRRALPWVEVGKPYTFATDDGDRTLEELFDGRSQLLVYHIMFGPAYEAACPGCSSLADHLDPALVHMAAYDVTLMCISRAPLEKLQAYKRRMGWKFPWASSCGSDYAFDFGFANTEEQMASPQFQALITEAPDWLQQWAVDVGTDLVHGLTESPGWAAFARKDGNVYFTNARYADDGRPVSPYFSDLLDETPHGNVEGIWPRRHDEYD